MASLYFSMMSSGLRQFLARPISVLVSALMPLVVRAPGEGRRETKRAERSRVQHRNGNEKYEGKEGTRDRGKGERMTERNTDEMREEDETKEGTTL